MARDLDKEEEQLLNGNRYVINTGEDSGVFLRDVDKLFLQYKNLRMSIYGQFKGYLSDPVSQKELMSYIDEQFVRLVKEYNINGPVDFPGYIKTKLTQRVKYSYIKGEYRDRNRVFVPKNDFDVTNLIEKQPSTEAELDYYATIEYVLKDVKLSDIEKLALYYILQEVPETQIVKNIKKDLEEFDKKPNKRKMKQENIGANKLREVVRDMKDFLYTKIESARDL